MLEEICMESLGYECYSRYFQYIKNDYKMALKFQKFALKIQLAIYNNINHISIAKSYNYLSQIYKYFNKLDEALEYVEKSYSMMDKMCQNNLDIVNVLNNYGEIYYSMSKYNQAYDKFKSALDIFRQIKDKQLSTNDNNKTLINSRNFDRIHAKIFNNIAIVQIEQSNYNDALINCINAFAIHKNIANDINTAPIASILANIAMIYKNMNQYDLALVNYELSLDILKKKNNNGKNNHDIALIFNNVGSVFRILHITSKALSYHYEAFNILQKEYSNNDHEQILVVLNNISLDYEKIGCKFAHLYYFYKACAMKIHLNYTNNNFNEYLYVLNETYSELENINLINKINLDDFIFGKKTSIKESEIILKIYKELDQLCEFAFNDDFDSVQEIIKQILHNFVDKLDIDIALILSSYAIQLGILRNNFNNYSCFDMFIKLYPNTKIFINI